MKQVDKEFENCACECDQCGNYELVDNTDYTEINKELRDIGWKTRLIDKEFLDFCSEDCLQKYKDSNA